MTVSTTFYLISRHKNFNKEFDWHKIMPVFRGGVGGGGGGGVGGTDIPSACHLDVCLSFRRLLVILTSACHLVVCLSF